MLWEQQPKQSSKVYIKQEMVIWCYAYRKIDLGCSSWHIVRCKLTSRFLGLSLIACQVALCPIGRWCSILSDTQHCKPVVGFLRIGTLPHSVQFGAQLCGPRHWGHVGEMCGMIHGERVGKMRHAVWRSVARAVEGTQWLHGAVDWCSCEGLPYVLLSPDMFCFSTQTFQSGHAFFFNL